jgi:hypothetical protein
MSTTTSEGATVGAGGPPPPGELDGTWKVERTGGFLPPMYGVTKRIAGSSGETRAGPLPGLGFDVVGLELRYRLPLVGWIDVLEPRADGSFAGRAQFLGRTVGTFSMRRIRSETATAA